MTVARGSKQDLATGTPVESMENLSGDGGIIQAISYTGGKVDYPIGSRAVSAIDSNPDLSALAKFDLGNAPIVQFWGESDTAASRCQLRPVWYTTDLTDPEAPVDVMIGADQVIELSVGTLKKTSAGPYISDGPYQVPWASCATKLAIYVVSLTPGSTWAIKWRGFS